MAHQGYERHTTDQALRAKGSLSYLQFIRVVQNVWKETHPDIPILPTGGDNTAQYPCILYGLELRQTMRGESKPKFREEISDKETGKAYVTAGQRFQNVVSFTVITEKDPTLAEEIIEVFEDFMLEMTPVFKEMGASEFVYSRRYSDSEINRGGKGVVMRRVSYLLTTERVVVRPVEKIESILVNLQALRHSNQIISNTDTSVYRDEEPRYYYAVNKFPTFYMNEDDIADKVIHVPYSRFRIGDRIILFHYPHWDFPEIDQGYYRVTALINEPFTRESRYEIEKITYDSNGDENATTVSSFGSGTNDQHGFVYYGKIFFVPDNAVEVNLLL